VLMLYGAFRMYEVQRTGITTMTGTVTDVSQWMSPKFSTYFTVADANHVPYRLHGERVMSLQEGATINVEFANWDYAVTKLQVISGGSSRWLIQHDSQYQSERYMVCGLVLCAISLMRRKTKAA